MNPIGDVPIKIVGLRPGEKLYEELFDEREERLPSALPGVFEAEPVPVPMGVLRQGFDTLAEAISQHDEQQVKALLFELIEHGDRRKAGIAPPRAAKAPTGRGWSPDPLVPQSS